MRLLHHAALLGLAIATSLAQAKQLSDTPTHDGWLKYGQLGWVWNGNYPWVYESDLGWIYAAEISSEPSAYWLYVQPESNTMPGRWYYYSEQDGPWTYNGLFGEEGFWKWAQVKNALSYSLIPIANLDRVPDRPVLQVKDIRPWTNDIYMTLNVVYRGPTERYNIFLFVSGPETLPGSSVKRGELKFVDAGDVVTDAVFEGYMIFNLLDLAESWGVQPGEKISLTLGDITAEWTYPSFDDPWPNLPGGGDEGDIPGQWGEVTP